MKIISEFAFEYSFLSNFHECKVDYQGLSYNSSESAYQAQKVVNEDKKKEFQYYHPGKAKRQGRKLKARTDWDNVKNQYMYEIVLAKFLQNDDIRKKLIDTGDAILIEGNTWNDTYWGVCNGVGDNHLGKILMQVREEIKLMEVK